MCCEYLTVDVIATEVAEYLLAKAAIQLKTINAEWEKRQKKRLLCQEAIWNMTL